MKSRKRSSFFGTLSDIFDPIIPAFLGAGMCAGISSLLSFCPEDSIWFTIHIVLGLIATSVNTYLPAWVGFSAAKIFGATPILGGMLGIVTVLDNIGLIAERTGMSSFLHVGSGGAISAMAGVFLLAQLEKFFHGKLSKGLDRVLTPFFALAITLFPYIFILMPIMGVITGFLSKILIYICSSDNSVVRIITGYFFAAIFLPAQLVGLQSAFQTIYVLQLEASGMIQIAPILSMGGAGQVGACIAALLKSKKAGNQELSVAASSGILPGVLGIGNALLYGVCVPYPIVLLVTGLGAGFGGVYIALTRVYATGWGSSGLLGIPLMSAGAHSPFINMLNYTIGLGISALAAFIIGSVLLRPEKLKKSD